MKIPKSYYILLILGLGLIVFIESQRPRPINWIQTFSSHDNIPFGTDALFELAAGFFPGEDIERVNKPFYELHDDDSTNYNLVYICQSFKISPEATDKLFQHVRNGNTVFISANKFDYKFLRRLGLRSSYYSISWIMNSQGEYTAPNITLNTKTDTAYIDTISAKISYHAGQNVFELHSSDSLNRISTLGWVNNDMPNFMSIEVGNGRFLIHSEPIAFTNYYLLRGNSLNYCEDIFQELPNKRTIWNDYPNNGYITSSSPMRYVTSDESLRFGIYLMFTTLILFLLLAGRRRQRAIPVIQPPENNSMEFIYSIRNLYLLKKDHNKVANHMIRGLKSWVYDQYGLHWTPEKKEFMEQLSRKSGMSHKDIALLLEKLKDIEKRYIIFASDLSELNQIIEKLQKNDRTSARI